MDTPLILGSRVLQKRKRKKKKEKKKKVEKKRQTKNGDVSFGTPTSQKREAVPRRVCI